MLKYALVSALLLIGLPAIADDTNTIKKSELDKLTVYKDHTILFDMKDGRKYFGPIMTPDCIRGRIYIDKGVENIKSFKLLHNEGFKTCEFDVKRVA